MQLSMQMITALHLRKTFGNQRAVDDLSLEVASGEIFGLVGPDGAGKTTTMRLLCGALLPDATVKPAAGGLISRLRRTHPQTGSAATNGSIEESLVSRTVIQIGEYDVLRQADQARSLIGYLPQRFSLYDDLTVLENLRFFAELRGMPKSEWTPRCMEILRFVDLDEFIDRRAGNLSGGMKQKLGLAAALAHRPRLLLLDEPTSGVDPVTRQDFWQLIIRLVSQANQSQEGMAVVVTTPYMDEAARCTRLGFLRDGQLLAEGTPAKMRARLEGQILELRGTPLNLLKQIAEADEAVEDSQMFGDRIHLRTRRGSAADVEARLRARISGEGGVITELRSVPAQLEDVFISFLH